MPTFKIDIVETSVYEVEVTAETPEQAAQEAEARWRQDPNAYFMEVQEYDVSDVKELDEHGEIVVVHAGL